MGIENLNTAARAAGFAMATSDEVAQEKQAETQPETESWRSGEAIMLVPEAVDAAKTSQSTTDWLKSLFGMSAGRRAPA